MGIVGAIVFPGTVNDVMAQITFGLVAATNIVLTALTGKSVYSIVDIQCLKSRSAGRILWIRRAASHVGLDCTLRSRYNTAIGVMYAILYFTVWYPLTFYPDSNRAQSIALRQYSWS
jgi:hypothetical protein